MDIKMFVGMWVFGWLAMLSMFDKTGDEIEEDDFVPFIIFCGITTFLICVFSFWLFS